MPMVPLSRMARTHVSAATLSLNPRLGVAGDNREPPYGTESQITVKRKRYYVRLICNVSQIDEEMTLHVYA